MSLNPLDRPNPQHLHANLLPELEGIAAKETTDARWFELDDDDHLTLRERPLDFLSCIWECLVRLFTNKLPRLEQKFIWISDQVEEYLRLENDEARLAEFLNRFTIPLNELYRSVARMQGAQRISEAGLAHLQTKARIRDYMITEIDPHRIVRLGAREYHPYLRSVFFAGANSIGQENGEHGVVFHCSAGHRLQDMLRDRVVTRSRKELHNFSADDQPLEIFAEVTKERTLVLPKNDSYLLIFDNNLVYRFAHKPLKPGDRRSLQFKNNSEKTMSIRIRGWEQVRGWEQARGEVQIGSGVEWNIGLDAAFKEESMTFSASYQTVRKPLFFGCKIAKYNLVVDQRGELLSTILPFHVTEQDVTTDHRIVDQPLRVENKNGSDILVRFSLRDFNHGWNSLIPPKNFFQLTRAQILKKFIPDNLWPNPEEPLRLSTTLFHLGRIIPPRKA